jgi:hypothetical protein
MEIRADLTLPFPREKVFSTYRDRLADLTEFLPNIRSIKVVKREERGDEVDLVNAWEGGGDIPKVARAVLSESMLRWTDYATWHAKDFTVAWRTDVHAFPGAVKSSGTNRFVEVPTGTRLEIRGDLTCDSSKVPGVPRLLAKTVNGAAEKLLVGQIGPNLVEVGKGVGKLLERER